MVRVVGVGDEHVAHVVQVAVVAAVPAEDGRLHQVAEDVDAGGLVQGHRGVVGLLGKRRFCNSGR